MKKWSFGASWEKCVELDFSQSRIFSILGPGGIQVGSAGAQIRPKGWEGRSTPQQGGVW